MITQELWLWIWFIAGTMVYMLKRAYYLVKGPNPVASTYVQFIEVCWIPLLVREAVDAGIFWASFYPDILNPIFSHFGLTFQLDAPMLKMPAVVAFFVGMGMDSIVDFAVTKIPYIKDWLPQMPPPLKPPITIPATPGGN